MKGIARVMLVGVHTNMCVLGRPFGLRQMAKNGKQVVLVRDMTDTMYNPARAPYVSHFTGTELIVEHIEKWVCPTITSDQILGGQPFQFKQDTRPHLVVVTAEREYETNRTLPKFCLEQLGKDFRVSHIFANAEERNDLPGIEVLQDADVLLLSVRRRVLPPHQMVRIRDFIESGVCKSFRPWQWSSSAGRCSDRSTARFWFVVQSGPAGHFCDATFDWVGAWKRA